MFTFLHTADWQIGRPFRSFGDRLGGLLEEARLTAITKIADAARDRGARHILVAGDVFDAETLPAGVTVPALERMAAAAHVQWHLIPGNHDPGRAGGLWDRVFRAGRPANVSSYLAPAVAEIEPGVSLLAAPLATKVHSTDPTAWMDEAATPEGHLRIGLAHGSVRDFAQSGDGGIVDPARARKAGLAYLALGDWHSTREVAPATWYAGTPEPDRFGAPDAGNALLVSVAQRSASRISRVRVGHFVWAEHRVTIASAMDLAACGVAIGRLAPSPDRLLLRLSIEGSIPLAERPALAEWCVRLGERLRHVELDDAALATHSGETDLAALLRDPRLVSVARRLAARAAQDSDPAVRRTADRALQRLVAITAAEAQS